MQVRIKTAISLLISPSAGLRLHDTLMRSDHLVGAVQMILMVLLVLSVKRSTGLVEHAACTRAEVLIAAASLILIFLGGKHLGICGYQICQKPSIALRLDV